MAKSRAEQLNLFGVDQRNFHNLWLSRLALPEVPQFPRAAARFPPAISCVPAFLRAQRVGLVLAGADAQAPETLAMRLSGCMR